MKRSIAAVIVTYNREKLLVECLESVISQNRIPEAIFIIDNNSKNATPELLLNNGWINKLPENTCKKNQLQEKKRIVGKAATTIYYVRKIKNDGGAGGFYEGIKQAYEHGYDDIWIMDDDVITRPDTLEALISARFTGDYGFLCSRVVGTNDISMNMPEINPAIGKNYYPVWDKFLKDGIVSVKSATFVSVLFRKEIVGELGYPIREMFIWGDDTEYTLRISKHYPCYYVGKSVVCHKRAISKPPSIKTEKDRKRLKMHFYRFRNQVFYTRKHMRRSQLFILIGEFFYKMCFLLIRLRIRSFYTMFRGLLSGLFFRPVIKYP